MKLKVIGHTITSDYTGEFNLEDGVIFSAKEAGICYSNDNVEAIFSEPKEKSYKRLDRVLPGYHHSVFDHYIINFDISEISKIMCMILNNEKAYATSEKSGRYTKFSKLSPKENELYNKWYEKLIEVIKEKEPKLIKPKAKNPYLEVQKKAMENARYFISVFAPVSEMGHSLSLKQINYIMYMADKFIKTAEDTPFNKLLKPQLKELIECFSPYKIEGLVPPEVKKRRLAFFIPEHLKGVPDEFNYNYKVTFDSSFACAAQNQRHRTETCYFEILEDNFQFYVPEILDDNEILKAEWLADANSIKELYPIGTLISTTQIGTVDTFIQKISERLCQSAQIEIMKHCVDIYNKFVSKSPYGYILEEYTKGNTARCGFSCAFKCSSPCAYGKNQYTRKI